MNNLYPPLINRILPPIKKQDNEFIFSIPFEDTINILSDENENINLQIKIMGISSNNIYSQILTVNVQEGYISYNQEQENYQLDISFAASDFTTLTLYPKLFYRIQLRYYSPMDDTVSSLWSDTGVAKCIDMAGIECIIDGLNSSTGSVNRLTNFFKGVYSNLDKSETITHYEFDIYDHNGDIFATSGKLVHNLSDTTISSTKVESIDTFRLNKELIFNNIYTLVYRVWTVNGLEKSSQAYNLMDDNMIKPEISAVIIPELDYENGCINISLNAQLNENLDPIASSGAFYLLRASEIDNYSDWTIILEFQLTDQIPNLFLWQDFLVEQGVKYKYAIQQYSDTGLRSAKLISTSVTANFEDAFLFDGERQLSIKYNPKITNFKTVKAEGKIDTIGSKYPFITSNGSMSYKSFSISGLLSILSDNQKLFRIKDNENFDLDFSSSNSATALTMENFKAERNFKLLVLDWLNNGKPKLFKSPGEGNYIVALQGVSLAPNDTLGRMLHTFSATAYEIADFNLDFLKQYNIFRSNNIIAKNYNLKSIILTNIVTTSTSKSYYRINTRQSENPANVRETFTYCLKFPKTTIDTLVVKDLPETAIVNLYSNTSFSTLIESFHIGKTHQLTISGIKNIKGIKILNIPHQESYFNRPKIKNTASVDVSYSIPVKKNFEKITEYSTETVLCQQIIGGTTTKYLIGGKYLTGLTSTISELEPLSNSNKTQTTVLRLNKLKAEAKEISNIHIYVKENNDHSLNLNTLYKDSAGLVAFEANELAQHQLIIYTIYDINDNYKSYYMTYNDNNEPVTFSTLDMTLRLNNNIYTISNNGDILVPQNTSFEQEELDGILAMSIGNGIFITISYPKAITTYSTAIIG